MPRGARLAAQRALIFLASAALSAASGLLVVRLLPASGYAAYQTLTKRVVKIVQMFLGPVEVWAVRDSALHRPGHAAAALALSLPASLAGLAAGYLLVSGISGSTVAGVLAGLSGAVLALRGALFLSLEGRRLRAAPATRLVQRLTQLILLAGLAAAGGLTVSEAVGSYLAGLLAAVAVSIPFLRGAGLSWRGALGLILRMRDRLRSGVLSALVLGLPGLDAAIVYMLTRDPELLAAFYAARLIPFTLLDVLRNTFRQIHVEMLRGAQPGPAARSALVGVALLAPVPAFTLAYPLHTMYLLKPAYAWASPLLALFSIEIVVLLLGVASENLVLGATPPEPGAEERGVETLYLLLLPSAAGYLALAAAAGILAGTGAPRSLALLAWGSGAALMAVLYAAGTAVQASRLGVEEWVYRIYSRGLAVLSAAILLALTTRLLPPPPPRPGFWGELLVLAPRALAYYAAWMLALYGARRLTRRRAGSWGP